MNFEQARLNMIEQQIRTWEVLDQRTLDLLGEIHREDFIPEEYKALSLSDTRIPLDHGQVTMSPREEARLIQSLNFSGGEKVLEVGTGCGYLTALLAKCGNTVHSIDIFPSFVDDARSKFAKYGLKNITVSTGDGINGKTDTAPYDIIVLTGSLPVLNNTIQQQLNLGGRLFAIIGTSPVMEATLITREGENEWSTEVLFETDLPHLIGNEPIPTFNF